MQLKLIISYVHKHAYNMNDTQVYTVNVFMLASTLKSFLLGQTCPSK